MSGRNHSRIIVIMNNPASASSAPLKRAQTGLVHHLLILHSRVESPTSARERLLVQDLCSSSTNGTAFRDDGLRNQARICHRSHVRSRRRVQPSSDLGATRVT
eukprot:3416813-Prymnesium_polylepis.1